MESAVSRVCRPVCICFRNTGLSHNFYIAQIYNSSPGGYRSPTEDWETIQISLVQAMNRLDSAIKPLLSLAICKRNFPAS